MTLNISDAATAKDWLLELLPEEISQPIVEESSFYSSMTKKLLEKAPLGTLTIGKNTYSISNDPQTILVKLFHKALPKHVETASHVSEVLHKLALAKPLLPNDEYRALKARAKRMVLEAEDTTEPSLIRRVCTAIFFGSLFLGGAYLTALRERHQQFEEELTDTRKLFRIHDGISCFENDFHQTTAIDINSLPRELRLPQAFQDTLAQMQATRNISS